MQTHVCVCARALSRYLALLSDALPLARSHLSLSYLSVCPFALLLSLADLTFSLPSSSSPSLPSSFPFISPLIFLLPFPLVICSSSVCMRVRACACASAHRSIGRLLRGGTAAQPTHQETLCQMQSAPQTSQCGYWIWLAGVFACAYTIPPLYATCVSAKSRCYARAAWRGRG